MIRAIIWKEFQEQGLIALTLILLGFALLAVAIEVGSPALEGAAPTDVLRFLGTGGLATLALAVTAGMVCGGALFAGERECGTMSFLESLPGGLRQIWCAKLIAGFGLTVCVTAVFLAAAAVLGLVHTPSRMLSFLVYALLAFSWGLFGSTRAQTTLGSVGLAIPTAAVTAGLAYLPIAVFFQRGGTLVPTPRGALFFLGVMFTTPVLLSAWLFTKRDRDRSTGTGRPRPRLTLTALVWLTAHQLLLPTVVSSLFAAGLGLCLLSPGIQPFLFWPFLALAAGTLSGVTAFADEQTRGSARYWAEQRLPLGELWLVKIVFHLGLCLWLLTLLALPCAVRAQIVRQDAAFINYGHSILGGVLGTALMDELGPQGWKYVLLPAAYGFAAGHICSLLFKKWVVASAVGCVLGGVVTVLWEPSILSGGLRHWQVWVTPAVLLLTSRLLLRPWAAEQLGGRRPVAVLVTGGVVATLALAAGLGYRVLEVPDSPLGEEDVRYVAALIPFEENLGGREFKSAAERFSLFSATMSHRFERPNAEPPPPGKTGGRHLRPEERLEQVIFLGWPANDPNLEAWLDEVFTTKRDVFDEPNWQALLASAVARLPGIYEHPQMIGVQGVLGNSLESARRMAIGLLGRGLQLQARGDPLPFVQNFRSVLKLAGTLKNGSVFASLLMGYDIERQAYQALGRWAQNLPPESAALRAASAGLPANLCHLLPDAFALNLYPDAARLLRRAIPILEENDSTEPFDATPHYLAERHILREALKAPTQWLPQQLGMPLDELGAPDPIVDLVSTAWAVPWERERTRRLVGLGHEAGLTLDHPALSGRPGASLFAVRNRKKFDLEENDRLTRVIRRAEVLLLAVQVYRDETGQYPEKLSTVVDRGLLKQLPNDPYDDTRSFGYRISAGEVLRSLSRADRERSLPSSREEPGERPVPAGQAIVWSVGPDRIDQGGTNPPGQMNRGTTMRPGDLVFLVPLRGHK